MLNIKPRRLGRFYVNEGILNDLEMMRHLMDACIVFDTKHDQLQGRIRYIAYCEDFEIVEQGAKMPTYAATIIKEDGVAKVRWHMTGK